MKNRMTEQLKQLSPGALKWIEKVFNDMIKKNEAPKTWKSHIIAILRLGKDPESLASYRPILLLSHLMKAFERIIMNRITCIVKEKLIKDHAGFQAGKSSSDQVLNRGAVRGVS